MQRKINNPNPHNNTSNKPKKWTMFTHYSSLIQKVTNLFRQTNVLLHSLVQTLYMIF